MKGATISGKVTAPAGVDLSNAYVSASPSAAQAVQTDRTASVAPDGSYKIMGLPAGSYKLQFSGWNTGALDQWYKNAASFAAATAVTVAAGQDLTGINATLVRGATISGKITAPAGATVSNVRVSIWLASSMTPVGQSRQCGTGRQLQDHRPAGWVLRAPVLRLEHRGRGQWYKNASSFDTATVVTVATGQNLAGINATLVKGATISGKVTAPAGVELGKINVRVSGRNDGRARLRGGLLDGMIAQRHVNPDGGYQVTGLAAGSYKFFISGWNTGAADQWYDKAGSFANGPHLDGDGRPEPDRR